MVTRKNNKNTKLTFLYNYSSDHTEKTEAKSHSEGAVKLLAAIWIHLYRTIINSAFYKSGPHSRGAKRKALMEDMSGGLRAQGKIFCGVIKPSLNFSAVLQSTLFGKTNTNPPVKCGGSLMQ